MTPPALGARWQESWTCGYERQLEVVGYTAKRVKCAILWENELVYGVGRVVHMRAENIQRFLRGLIPSRRWTL